MSEFDVVVLGGGPAGANAALAAASTGLSVALFDENPSAGGQVYRAPIDGPGAGIDAGSSADQCPHGYHDSLLNHEGSAQERPRHPDRHERAELGAASPGGRDHDHGRGAQGERECREGGVEEERVGQ